MREIKGIKNNIKELAFEMDCLKIEVDREGVAEEIKSQFDTTESVMQGLIEKVTDLIDILEDLI